MKKIRILLLCLVGIVILACGGGGSFSEIRISGRVLDISTGAPTTTSSSVQSSSATAATSTVDGSFIVGAPKNETQLLVSGPSLLAYPVFTYTFSALTQSQNDVGDLWIGPEQVSVTGKVLNAADDTPVANAVVRFAGQMGVTDASGNFSVANVAYSSADTTSFEGITGRVEATNFLSNEFTPNGATANAGIVDVGVLLITPVDSDSPPPLPYNIWGVITPSGLASGTIVTLKSGGTTVRRFTVGTDARYQFWVNAGSYTIEFANGTHTAPDQNVTLNNSSDVIRADATLN
ncbi:MAG: hypothetical protein GC165_06365 [Armatimonadetes bacterium]|nr:hypothetical protein [Armatimonadota bacterium]MBS1726112.1 hypothetical protein [Armatimonadota bacterium]